jgi:kynureninase
VYIHERFHNDNSLPRYAGWWGYDKATRFKMEKGFIPINTAEGWQLSTPSILLYAAHKAALGIFEQASMPALHSKRLQLNNYAWWLLQQLPVKNFTILTPANAAERGCQLSLLMHRNGKAVYDALMQDGFITDWREPDVIRFASVPLYNTFEEVWRFIDLLKRIA